MSMPVAPRLGADTILIVDDTPANLGVIAESLASHGFRVLIAQDGEEGLERMAFVQPDLILLDVLLPGMNGFEVCRRLKAFAGTRDIPVIFMTALADTEHKIAGFAVGGVDYVTKPLQIEEVVARVNTHLRLRILQKQLEVKNAQLQKWREELEQRVAERTAELSASRMQLRALAVRRDQAREEERKRIARELHDELGQFLTALRMNVSLLRVRFGENNPALMEHVKSMTELVDRNIQVVRNVASTLRPAALDLGVQSALEWLVEEFVTHTGIPCELHVTEESIDLDEHSGMAMFRVVQESLTNVARHANASRVRVALQRMGQHYRLEVHDNGRGFDPDHPRKNSLGLIGMHERVLMLGGEVRIASKPGQGTTLEAHIPIQDAPTTGS